MRFTSSLNMFLRLSLFTQPLFAQQDTIILDKSSGNYSVFYKGTVTLAKDSAGNLRRLSRDDELRLGETVIEKDSVFSTIFEPGTKIKPEIKCSVAKSHGGELVFHYEAQNGSTSQQSLASIIVEFGDVSGLRAESENGWNNGRMMEPGGEKLSNRWDWFPAGKKAKAIEPGNNLGGYKLIALSQVKIGRAFLQGRKKINPRFFGGIPTGEVGKQISRLQVFPANYVIVPTIVPNSFEHIFLGTFLDTLLSYTRQSAELGWLGRSRDDNCDDEERPDDGITKNIEKRLEKAKKELSKGDSTKARKELEKLVDKVERIWKRSQDEEKKHKGEQRERKEDVIMTGEAYALLLYNTEYLIDRLPDGKEKKGEKEKKGGDKDDD